MKATRMHTFPRRRRHIRLATRLAVALVLLLIAAASLAPVGHTAVPDGQAAIDATRTVG
jgi:hypothetical protein